jgi:2-dehydropantoate 2-reductase
MIGENTVVIPLLNGVVVSELLMPHLPKCILADGCIRIFCNLVKPGHIFHQMGGNTVIGMKDGSQVPLLHQLAHLLSEAGIPTKVSEDIALDSWKKYVTMCGFSTIFCWFDAPAGGVLKTSGYEEVCRGVFNEIVSVATAKGICLPEDTIDKHVKAFSELPADTMSSLYRDLRAGKPPEQTELFHIIGRIVELGKELDVPTPYCKGAFDRKNKK